MPVLQPTTARAPFSSASRTSRAVRVICAAQNPDAQSTKRWAGLDQRSLLAITAAGGRCVMSFQLQLQTRFEKLLIGEVSLVFCKDPVQM